MARPDRTGVTARGAAASRGTGRDVVANVRGLKPVSRLNRATGDLDVVRGLYAAPARPDRMIVEAADGQFWDCRRFCPHQGADLLLTGTFKVRSGTVTCSRHPDQGPFTLQELGARRLFRHDDLLLTADERDRDGGSG